jgi:hypothetical protein
VAQVDELPVAALSEYAELIALEDQRRVVAVSVTWLE